MKKAGLKYGVVLPFLGPSFYFSSSLSFGGEGMPSICYMKMSLIVGGFNYKNLHAACRQKNSKNSGHSDRHY